MNPRDIPPEAFHSNGAEVQALDFGYVRSPDQDRTTPAQHPVVVIGAGPVGLSLAIDLAQRGQRGGFALLYDLGKACVLRHLPPHGVGRQPRDRHGGRVGAKSPATTNRA